MVTEEHITAFGWATPQEIDEVMALALRVNDFLVGLFLGIGIRLIDFKIEFGRQWDNEQMRIVLADEISPDCCRLWDAATSDKLDKDRFRRDLGGVLEAYQEVARRLGVLTENPRPKGSGPGACQLQTELTGTRPRRFAACATVWAGASTSGIATGIRMQARIKITLKHGVLDPQGKAIENALTSLGSAASTRSARASTSRSIWPSGTKPRRAPRWRRSARTCSPTPSSKTMPTSW